MQGGPGDVLGYPAVGSCGIITKAWIRIVHDELIWMNPDLDHSVWTNTRQGIMDACTVMVHRLPLRMFPVTHQPFLWQPVIKSPQPLPQGWVLHQRPARIQVILEAEIDLCPKALLSLRTGRDRMVINGDRGYI